MFVDCSGTQKGRNISVLILALISTAIFLFTLVRFVYRPIVQVDNGGHVMYTLTYMADDGTETTKDVYAASYMENATMYPLWRDSEGNAYWVQHGHLVANENGKSAIYDNFSYSVKTIGIE